MKHFTMAEWIDFVNRVADPKHAAVMQEHLEEGCQTCATELARWERIRQVAIREKGYQPPKEIVHMAKAAFSASAWAQDRKTVKGAIELLFDSFRQPLPAGVRSAGSRLRRMLYQADSLTIDLQIERRAEGQRIVVTGQLLDVRPPGTGVRDMKVTLSNGRGPTVEARTNKFGEFREEIEDSRDLKLKLPSASGKPVVISLPDVFGRSRDKGE